MDSNFCKNCTEMMPPKALYCPSCGQKDSDGKIPVRQFISEFFSSVFNLDSRFLNTLKYVFVPARLTKEYFKGKHKSYAHPLRLFFIIAVVHLSLIGIVANANIGIGDTDIAKSKMQLEKAKVYELIEKYEREHLAKYHNAEVTGLLDSLKNYVRSNGDFTINRNSYMSFPHIYMDSLKVEFVDVRQSDMVELTFDELIEKHNIRSSLSKIWLQQQIKAQEDPKSLILFGIGNMIWMLILLLPIVALFMKMLYIRRGFFYIEHLVFLYHWHAVAFIIMSIFFLLMMRIHPAWLPLFFFLILVFGFIALRRFYNQGFFRSAIKFFLILVFYVTAMVFLIAVTSFVSMLVF